MIVRRAPDEITIWSVAFFEGAHYRFARLVPGRFKHVLAFGYSDPCRTWVIYDIGWAKTRIYVLPDGQWGLDALADILKGATVLRLARDHVVTSQRFRLGFWCVPAVRHLIGCRCGAWLPTGLHNGLIAEGAEVIQHGQQQPASTLRSARAG